MGKLFLLHKSSLIQQHNELLTTTHYAIRLGDMDILDNQSRSLPPFFQDETQNSLWKEASSPPSPVQRTHEEKIALRDLEHQTFAIAFETILEKMSEGISFTDACREYHSPLPPARLRSWVFANRKRKEAYLVAKALAAEAVEDELLRISDGMSADGTRSLSDDVNRSKLRIETRWKMLGVWNRQRYGDVKQIEQTTTTKLDVATVSSDELRSRILRSLGMDDISDMGDGVATSSYEDDDDV